MTAGTIPNTFKLGSSAISGNGLNGSLGDLLMPGGLISLAQQAAALTPAPIFTCNNPLDPNAGCTVQGLVLTNLDPWGRSLTVTLYLNSLTSTPLGSATVTTATPLTLMNGAVMNAGDVLLATAMLTGTTIPVFGCPVQAEIDGVWSQSLVAQQLIGVQQQLLQAFGGDLPTAAMTSGAADNR